MTDKELIKKEIERQIEEGKVKCLQSKENNNYENFVAWSEHIATCVKILQFINSLPEEPFDYTNVNIIPKDFGELPQTIEQAAVQAHIELEECNGLSFVNAFSKGAEWKKQQMMKDAVDSIVEDWCGDFPEITIPLNLQDFKTGDKVKIIIFKTEQQ